MQDLDPEQPRTLVALFPDGPDHDTAEILLKLLGDSTSPSEVPALRRSLFDAWQAFVDLRSKAAEAGDGFKNSPAPDQDRVFQKIILFSAEMPLDPPDLMDLGEGFAKPTVPIFEKQDILILKHIESWLGKREVSGLRVALDQAKVEIPLNAGLAGQLKCLDQEGVREALAMERGTAASGAPTAKTRGAAIDPEAINSAYNAVGDFFARVASLAGH